MCISQTKILYTQFPSNFLFSDSMKVDIISTEFIKPSSPTPPHLEKFKLSFLDQRIPSHFIPLIFYYSYNETTNITQSDMVFRLKRSLSDALTHFYPLAGRMQGLSSVLCKDQGVKYMEARFNCQVSDVIETPQVELLDQLLPYNLDGFEMMKSEEQLAIQVNLFSCGGIVLGTCISHRIADMCAFCTFLKSWATIARGESNFARPLFDSSTLFPPGESSDYDINMQSPSVLPSVERLVAKRFVFTASTISALKTKVVNSSGVMHQPTRVEIVTAFIWKCIGKKGEKTAVFHPVNLRGRMVPPLPDYTFGNVFQMASAVDMNGEAFELNALVGKMRDAFEKIDNEYISKLLSENGYEFAKNNFKRIGQLMSQKDMRVLRFGSWVKLSTYEADFGWGKPTWVSSASYTNKDTVFLLDSRLEGGIEAWIYMNVQDMAAFEQDPDVQLYISSSK